MNTRFDQLLLLLIGAALVTGGLLLLSNDSLILPARQKALQFHFVGPTLWLIGMSPIILGATLLALAARVIERGSGYVLVGCYASAASFALAYILTPKL